MHSFPWTAVRRGSSYPRCRLDKPGTPTRKVCPQASSTNLSGWVTEALGQLRQQETSLPEAMQVLWLQCQLHHPGYTDTEACKAVAKKLGNPAEELQHFADKRLRDTGAIPLILVMLLHFCS